MLEEKSLPDAEIVTSHHEAVPVSIAQNSVIPAYEPESINDDSKSWIASHKSARRFAPYTGSHALALRFPLHRNDSNVILSRRRKNLADRKTAFTLAEVLITLGIIGVVAAITLPALITNVQARIRLEQIRTAKYKFTKATDKMKSLDLIGPYENTESFINELKKHLKIAKICDSSHLEGCWPTTEVTINNDGKTFEISKAKTGKSFKMLNDEDNDYTSDNVGIVTADGTPMILSYNKNVNPLNRKKHTAGQQKTTNQ